MYSDSIKIIYTGLESSGKSYMLALMAKHLVERNAKWKTKFNIERPIWSNLKFSKEFEKKAEDLGVKLYYWKTLQELVKVSEADVLMDEVGNYFDSRFWQDLNIEERMWLNQGAKSGIDFYGTSQDFAQVDKSFRRLCTDVLEINKVIGSPRPAKTKPPIKTIYGILWIRGINPRSYKEDNKEYETGFSLKFRFIKEEICQIFDTQKKVERNIRTPLRHEIKYCEHHKEVGGNGTCQFCKIVHN